MDPIKPYPSLSSRGWIETPEEILDSVISNYFVSYSSEDVGSSDHIYTLQELIQQHGSSMDDITTNVMSSLTTILGRYFPTVSVEVKTHYPFPNDETRYGIIVAATIRTLDNVPYDLCKSVDVEGSTIVKIMKVNNDG